MAITLYDLCGRDERLRFSPYCWRVRMALAHKGLEYTTVPWRFLDKEALAFADYDKVPVLTDGDTVVTDSFEIMRYLDKAYPANPVLGEGVSYQRVHFFKLYIDRSVTPALFRTVALDLLAAIHPDDRSYFRETREARFGMRLEDVNNPEQGRVQLKKLLAPVRDQLRSSPFLDGETPSGADYLLFGSMMWAYTVSLEPLVDANDPVDEWFKRMLEVHEAVAGKAITIRDL
ncbi:glutathione S-transferase family protein [Vreelandella venusta]|uniref:Glutathione S-transferase n=1 Tax=Vreelandella venusta TaxID=44935 RepID=A0AAQ0CFV2_9GAMM|nr:glutathione S-transferase family protein [Halomonas venusta]AZM97109.1 glutathione S-transferase family protein [Halomonas venusta]MDX1355148.1 glutathione S-transferase family protein [Halomonas venusta]NPT31832.1 glutathione S-transferase [Halomonas venusta]QPI63389.1 glutathione S-transferase family protein [Halomonas venusta]QRL02588.1 glutathione S-transferase family protein [Halomonas venusta]